MHANERVLSNAYRDVLVFLFVDDVVASHAISTCNYKGIFLRCTFIIQVHRTPKQYYDDGNKRIQFVAIQQQCVSENELLEK